MEAYIRLVKILQKGGPLCPEIHPYSRLGLLCQDLLEHPEAARLIIDDNFYPKFMKVEFPEKGMNINYSIPPDTYMFDKAKLDKVADEMRFHPLIDRSKSFEECRLLMMEESENVHINACSTIPVVKCGETHPSDMIRKVLALRDANVFTPEIAPDSWFSKLENWFISQIYESDRYEVDHNLIITGCEPIRKNGKLVGLPFLFTAFVGNEYIVALCSGVDYIDSTMKDLYHSSRICGTDEENTDGKMMYTVQN